MAGLPHILQGYWREATGYSAVTLMCTMDVSCEIWKPNLAPGRVKARPAVGCKIGDLKSHSQSDAPSLSCT